MKEKTSKIVLVLTSLFFGVFLFCNTALAETGDKGIIVDGFYYNENQELVFSWSVDYGFSEWWKTANNSYYGLSRIGMGLDGYNYLYLNSWYWGYIYFSEGSSDCVEYIDGYNYTTILAEDFGSKVCSVKFKTIGGSYLGNPYSTGSFLTKADIDYKLSSGGNLESGEITIDNGYPFNFYRTDGGGGTYVPDLTYPLTSFNSFPLVPLPADVDGVCGTADGSTFNYADYDTQDWCSAGDFYFSGTEYNGTMIYSCTGTGGGATDTCSASYYINGDCGTVSGTTQTSLSIENENLCSYSYLLDETSFSNTATGWSWICNGLYGGQDNFCSADKTDIAFPVLPESEDCSSYSFPNSWICNINNTITSAFLPSAEKMNDLNLSINALQQKAPFNYLNLAKTKITELTGNISQDSLSITILGNTSTLNETGLTDFADNIKKFFSLVLMFAFLFWGLNYIKHFFK